MESESVIQNLLATEARLNVIMKSRLTPSLQNLSNTTRLSGLRNMSFHQSLGHTGLKERICPWLESYSSGAKTCDSPLHEARNPPHYSQRTPKYCQVQSLSPSVCLVARTIRAHQSPCGKLQLLFTEQGRVQRGLVERFNAGETMATSWHRRILLEEEFVSPC